MTRPLAPQWLLDLERHLRRAGLPMRELVAGAGRLCVSLQDGHTPGLEAFVEPLATGRPGWATTRRFVLGYDGPGTLGAPAESWMRELLHVLRRMERHVPPALDEPCGVFAPDTAPEQRFARLFPFCTVEHSTVGTAATTEILARTTDRCNQACPFCSAPPRIHEPSTGTVRACIDMAAATFPGAVFTLTGGEPTLRRSFTDELGHAAHSSAFSQVLVQTNAIAFDGRLTAHAIEPNERVCFFISLHALDEHVYDRCTGTHRQLPRALAGARALIEAEHRVVVNCVVSRLNLDHLPDLVRALPQTLPWHAGLELHFSVLMCPEHRPEAPAHLVPYSDLAPALEAAVQQAESVGVRVSPLRSSTHASLPACVLAPEYRDASPRRPELRSGETGYEDVEKPWVKAHTCRTCVESDRCLGVPRAYAQALGLGELRPIRGG